MILKIDVDTPRGRLPLTELRRRARIVHMQIVRVQDTRSPSGRGWHRRIEVEYCPAPAHSELKPRSLRRTRVPWGLNRQAGQLSPFEIVFLQLLFGSDPIRESFNWHRARLVAAGQVPRFWKKRWDTLYATSGGQ